MDIQTILSAEIEGPVTVEVRDRAVAYETLVACRELILGLQHLKSTIRFRDETYTCLENIKIDLSRVLDLDYTGR